MEQTWLRYVSLPRGWQAPVFVIGVGTLYAIADDRDVIGFGLHNFPMLLPVGGLIVTVGAVLYPVDPGMIVIPLTPPLAKEAVAVA